MTIFANTTDAPLDPVLASFEGFLADPRKDKVNLGVGMYYDENGRIPLLGVVAEARRRLAVGSSAPWSYIPVEGQPGFRAGVEELIFSSAPPGLRDGRIAVFQTVGGTGSFSVGAQLLHELAPKAKVAISDPGWSSHPPLFEAAGLEVTTYPYLAGNATRIDAHRMLEHVDKLAKGSIVVIQACGHNPTGCDLSAGHWREIADVVARRELVPFLDLAYQGFGRGIDDDSEPIRLLAATGAPVLAGISFSKSFALYGERVGALCLVTGSAAEAGRILNQLKNVVRAQYTTPPTNGAAIVETVLGDPVLKQQWRGELDDMRTRVEGVRRGLSQRLAALGSARDFSFLEQQAGLFSYTGLSPGQVARLRSEHAIHMLDTGRMCMTALNTANLDRVAAAVANVVGQRPA